MDLLISQKEFAQLIYSTNLGIGLREADIRLSILEAEKYGITSVLVNPCNVSSAIDFIEQTAVKISAVTSYPIGAYPLEIKEFEIKEAICNGAESVVMLMGIGVFLDGFYEQTQAEMNMLANIAHDKTTFLMLEASALNDEQKVLACKMAIEVGIDFIITSTDFKPNGFGETTIEDVELLVEAAAGQIGIVAAGEIRTARQAITMLNAGACRICSPVAVDIIRGFNLIRDGISMSTREGLERCS